MQLLLLDLQIRKEELQGLLSINMGAICTLLINEYEKSSMQRMCAVFYTNRVTLLPL